MLRNISIRKLDYIVSMNETFEILYDSQSIVRNILTTYKKATQEEFGCTFLPFNYQQISADNVMRPGEQDEFTTRLSELGLKRDTRLTKY
jgi:hypothetical protein